MFEINPQSTKKKMYHLMTRAFLFRENTKRQRHLSKSDNNIKVKLFFLENSLARLSLGMKLPLRDFARL